MATREELLHKKEELTKDLVVIETELKNYEKEYQDLKQQEKEIRAELRALG